MVLLSSNSHSIAEPAEDLSQYRWQNRLLVVIDERGASLFKQVNDFKTAHACAFKNRKLILKKFIKDTDSWNKLPSALKQKNGLYLIGLDGGVKAYSSSDDLLSKLDSIIDAMPMRSRELLQSDKHSECVD